MSPSSNAPARRPWLRNATSAANCTCSREVVADNLTGAAPVSQIMADAARTERDIQKILQRMDGLRLDHMTTATRQIAAHGPFRDGIDFASARDVIWTLTSPEVFLLLTRHRGWSKEKYATWLADSLISALLP